MLVEAVILDGDLRLPHDRRNVLQLHRDPVLVVEVRQGLAVTHQHLAASRWRRGGKLTRQALELGGCRAAGHTRNTGEWDKQPCDQNTGEDTDDEEHDK